MVKFGTGGWRAIIGEEFTKENIQKLTLAMCLKMKAEHKDTKSVVIGYDRRFLSKEAVIWACQILGKEGIHVQFVNRSAPTPLLMFYVMKHELDYGMMVTASHNPAIYNGIKVFTYGGRDADEIQTKDIEKWLLEAEKLYTPCHEEDGQMPPPGYTELVKQGIVEEINPMNEYLDNILSVINVDAIRKRDLRVAVDPMYGVSLTALSTILAVARCTVETINAQHDTLFGGKMPAPAQDTLKNLQNYVLDRYCDIGIATDGDADRLGVIDDKGHYLHANQILVMLYYYLLKYKGWRGDAVRNLAKDGIYAASLLVEMIAVTGKSLSGIVKDIEDQYGETHMEERSYRFTAEEKARIHRMLLEEQKLPQLPFEVSRVSYQDGCKVYFKNGGWVSARFSGTEPLLRIFCEMEKEEDAVRACVVFERFLSL